MGPRRVQETINTYREVEKLDRRAAFTRTCTLHGDLQRCERAQQPSLSYAALIQPHTEQTHLAYGCAPGWRARCWARHPAPAPGTATPAAPSAIAHSNQPLAAPALPPAGCCWPAFHNTQVCYLTPSLVEVSTAVPKQEWKVAERAISKNLL